MAGLGGQLIALKNGARLDITFEAEANSSSGSSQTVC